MRSITPFLWFDSQAEAAAEFYISLFPNSRIVQKSYCGEDGPGPAGSVLVVEFELNGQRFMALNGGPRFRFTEAVSFSIDCETQDEVDNYWRNLTEGGQELQCGWLKDKFGLFWQVIPVVLGKLMSDPDPAKASRVLNAMLRMTKFDIAALERAYHGD